MLVITCHFNPCRYVRPIENYWRFRDALGAELQTIELSYDGQFDIPDALQVRGTSANLMWQKERLLNILIERSDADKVAWVDADILFENPNWHQETIELLDDYPAVQMLESLSYLDKGGRVMLEKQSLASKYASGQPVRNCFPGGCWAARREAIPGGIMDRNILGGGDVWQALAWLGEWQGWLANQINPAGKQSWLSRAIPYYQFVKGNVGCVSGHGYHLYHGTRENRRYVERLNWLIKNDFDPETDIGLDENGLWKWTSEKPELHNRVADYFKMRNEDD